MTEASGRIMKLLREHIAAGDPRPTNNRLAALADLSIVTVDNSLRELERNGVIRRTRVGNRREITICDGAP